MVGYGIKERKERWLDFMSSDKHSGPMFQINLKDELVRPWPTPYNKKERIKYALKKYENYIENMNWLKDDRVPCLHVYSGTEIFAEAFGCKVHRPDDNMPFALPLINSSSEVAKLKVPELGSSTLSLLFEIADELKDKVGQGAIFQLPDVQSPLDIAALIWEKTDFYIALLEEPDAVKELMNKIKYLMIEFFDTWFQRYGTEYIAHYPYYYMKGGITLSEDEVGVINSDMFNEFALSDLVELSQHYGGLGIHCCANSRHQWDNFKRIPYLKLLNLVQPKERIKEAYKYFADHTCQMHVWGGDGDPWTWPDQHPSNARIVFEVPANNKHEAILLADKLWQACCR